VKLLPNDLQFPYSWTAVFPVFMLWVGCSGVVSLVSLMECTDQELKRIKQLMHVCRKIHGEKALLYEAEAIPKLRHTKPGLLSMVNCGNNM